MIDGTNCNCACSWPDYSHHALSCPYFTDGKSARLAKETPPSSKKYLYGELANRFIELTYSDPSVQATMAINDFAEWLDKQGAHETREDGPHCGTCQCLETDGAFPPAATEHQHEWVPSSTPGQETCVSCHCYRPAVKTTPALCGSMSERGHACELERGHGGLCDWEQP